MEKNILIFIHSNDRPLILNIIKTSERLEENLFLKSKLKISVTPGSPHSLHQRPGFFSIKIFRRVCEFLINMASRERDNNINYVSLWYFLSVSCRRSVHSRNNVS